jgi:hypothetical protein
MTAELAVGMLTVIVSEAEDGVKPVLPPYEAVILLAPVANWLPYTVSEALPELASGT